MLSKFTRAVPFYLHIAAMFAALFIVLGLIASTLIYNAVLSANIAHQTEQFDRVSARFTERLRHDLSAAKSTLSMLPIIPGLDLSQYWQGQQLTPMLVHLLEMSTSYSSIYMGNANGDFYQVSRVVRRPDRPIPIPDSAVWVVKETHTIDGLGVLTYLDAQLSPLMLRRLTEVDYDPRLRPWYQKAMEQKTLTRTKVYRFSTGGNYGVSLTMPLLDQRLVIGLDVSGGNVARFFAEQRLPKLVQVIIYDQSKQLLFASKDIANINYQQPLAAIKAYPQPVIRAFSQYLDGVHHIRPDIILDDTGREWQFHISRLLESPDIYLAMLVPYTLVENAAKSSLSSMVLLFVVSLLVILPMIWLVSRRITQPLEQLTRDANQIKAFKFDAPATDTGSISELNELSSAIEGIKGTLINFINVAQALSQAQDFETCQKSLVLESANAVGATGAALMLKQQEEYHLSQCCWRDQLINPDDFPVNFTLFPWFSKLLQGDRVRVNLSETEWHSFFAHLEAWPGEHDLLIEPLIDSQQQAVGMLLMVLPRMNKDLRIRRQQLIAALSSSAASAIVTQQLLQQQKLLLNSFIELLATAIDAKSPYTGSHCQRVPVLSKMLTHAAAKSTAEPFSAFHPNTQDWEAIHIAAWLHDCGKITTPEFVINKSTKLETIYNRIHEIRTRVEVIKRDRKIAALSALLTDTQLAQAQTVYQPQWQGLDDDFAFIAIINQAQHALTAAEAHRLEQLAEIPWQRTLDDQLGLSELEKSRNGSQTMLPSWETLLMDRVEHQIARPKSQSLAADNPWHFTLAIPTLLYHRGERYNLMITQGTLTAEERFKINEHIIQTIKMLEWLPFPQHLQQVPEIAGGHHERVDGLGYPRGLSKEQLSVPARILAIADIFEALTAADRPYKPGKTLSQTLALMQTMASSGHIDPDLYNLFLSSGVCHKFAQKYLSEQQKDIDDVSAYMVENDAPMA
ncbi:HD domain-containing phosphohydrolase [Shewanella sp. NIFS-20-20]|uniref:HD domain-containing phosphohydrolase n=1 Tax=Shewanella sp. NIFS-20-20 TaxID=2853806 RepID=UPI001C459CC0|nr:HD domain-containing phosphohydrolase [Shewanella sp. NIFS-20-20]MBV7315222.1 hypothetical protein [Shewanella sp. NIFS-20-20]